MVFGTGDGSFSSRRRPGVDGWTGVTSRAVLQGRSLVLRDPSGAVDFVLRDHHMIDVALYHYRTRGELPQALFHADRHSDYCRDGFLEEARPIRQPRGGSSSRIKRLGDSSPVLAEDRVFFANARAPHAPWMSGRAFEEELVIPWFLPSDELHWSKTLAREARPRLTGFHSISITFSRRHSLRSSGICCSTNAFPSC